MTLLVEFRVLVRVAMISLILGFVVGVVATCAVQRATAAGTGPASAADVRVAGNQAR